MGRDSVLIRLDAVMHQYETKSVRTYVL